MDFTSTSIQRQCKKKVENLVQRYKILGLNFSKENNVCFFFFFDQKIKDQNKASIIDVKNESCHPYQVN